MKTVALIPAYNEANRITKVIKEVKKYVDEVTVVDDGSSDSTIENAREAGAKVLTHSKNKGYLETLKTGFQKVEADVLITLDADGEMDPAYIPKMVELIESGEADLVMGKREHVPRWSERFLSSLAGLSVDVEDTGTGFRAIRSGLVKKMDLRGVCPCGTFVLEAEKLGAEIVEVPVKSREVDKPRGIAWRHFLQFFYIVRALVG